MSTRKDTSLSEPSPSGGARPTTRGHRPRTSAARPPNSRRPGTARPDTSVSSIGEIPDQTFGPDVDEEDYIDEEGEFSEEEDDVFAFERPITGAVPHMGLGFANREQPLPTADSTRPSEAPRTMESSATSTFAYVASSKGLGVAKGVSTRPAESTADRALSDPLSSSVVVLDYADRDAADGRQTVLVGNTVRRSSNPNVTAYAPATTLFDTRQTPARSQAAIEPDIAGKLPIERHHVHYKESVDSHGSVSFHHDEVSSSVQDSQESLHNDQVRQRTTSRLPLVDRAGSELTSEAGSRPMTRGTWRLSEIDGATTIPDGFTTRGDGQGNVLNKWDEEGGSINVGELEEEEDSPYPEVRASVSNIDDPEMPALTIRVWIIGLFFVIVGCGFNTFFTFRTPSSTLSAYMIPLLAYPVGKFFAWAMPIWGFRLPRRLGGLKIHLNPGPFNIKEHTLIVVMANVTYPNLYPIQPSVAAEVYLGRAFPTGFTILNMLATQAIGFGIAGMGRRFLVWPASMIWPTDLVTTTNLNVFHAEDNGDGGMTRYKFFMIFTSIAFAYYFLPGFLITSLSYFSWVCWMAPNNVVVNQLFGVNTGLGMGILTFDWNQVIWISSPLLTPWWAEVNIGIGFLVCYWLVVPILYYTNVWQSAYLPMSVSGIFDRYGQSYNISRILTKSSTLDIDAYNAYSPPYIPITFAMTLTLALALTTALIVHTSLHHGPSIWRAIRHTYSEPDDIHMKLMKQYPEVPSWWYFVVLVATIVMAIVSIEVYHTGVPLYALLIAIVLPSIYFLPGGFVYALTGQSISINLLAEMIPGYMMPGEILPNILMKSITVNLLFQSLQFTQDLKLGHYMKCPPRALFTVQIVAISVASFVAFGVKRLLFAIVPDMCSPMQKDGLSCPGTRVLFNSGMLWGLVGPQRFFGSGAQYHHALWALLAGAIVPVPFWWYARKRPNSALRLFNAPVLLNGSLNIPPANGINYSSFLVVGFIFQYLLRRRAFAWWSKYNYVLAAALNVGTLMAVVVVFLALGVPNVNLNWGGNTIWKNTLDYMGPSYKTVPETGFGPTNCGSILDSRRASGPR